MDLSFQALSALFVQGGPMMWPILGCSILGLALFLERWSFYLRMQQHSVRLSEQMLPLASDPEKHAELITVCHAHPSPLSRIVLAVLERGRKTVEVLRAEATAAAEREAALLVRYLGLLNTLATITPLLGLLGTVLGMIEAFKVLAAQGVGTPATLGGGISQALITTAAGLSVAIPLVLLHRYLNGRLDRMMIQIDGQVQQLIRVVSEDG